MYGIWLKKKIRRNYLQCIKCGAKVLTFCFWVFIYIVLMKVTLFRTSEKKDVKDFQRASENYTNWLLRGPVLGDDPESNLDDDFEPDIKAIKDIEDRVERVQNICSKQKALLDQPINNKEFFVDQTNNIVWCNIFKAASSYWLYYFNILGGYDKNFLARTRYNPLTLARRKYPRPTEEELKEAIKKPGVISLIIVRDPFVRLLSAYRDKLENIAPPFYRGLAKQIIKKYRVKKKKSVGPTFPEFVSYLVNEYANGNKSFNEHWVPYYKFCSPCSVNFTVIAKVETLSVDSKYVIHQLGLGSNLTKRLRDRRFNRRARLRTIINKSRDGRNTNTLVKYYYSQLSRDLLNGLIDIYGLDFELFGYDTKPYLNFVKN